MLAALLKNIHPLGFTLSVAAQERVARLTADEMKAFYQPFVEGLQGLAGYRIDWKPFYPNFPAQVVELSEAQLYLNALVHYLTNVVPSFTKEDRPPFEEQVNLKVIELGSLKDFESIFPTIVGSKTSISGDDKYVAQWFVSHYKDDILRLMPEAVPSRETLAVIGAVMLKETTVGQEWLRSKVTTATDVLRLAVAMHGGDVSLAEISTANKVARRKEYAAHAERWQRYMEEHPEHAPGWRVYLEGQAKLQKEGAEKLKFGKFSRAQRRFVLQLLEGCPNATEDMLRWQIQWVRLGEKLHPGEWAKRFPKTHAAFEAVRGNTSFATFSSSIETALLEGDSRRAIDLLSSRPGDFARRLDHLLRRFPVEASCILDSFALVADKVSTPVLLQVLTHFKHRDQPHDLRIFFPKGQVAKVWGEATTLEPLDVSLCEQATQAITAILTARFAKLPPLGGCYLDPELANFLAPFSQRSASKALRTVARGSRLSLPEGNTLRFFLWWRNGRERTDIDLSAVIYGGDFVYRDVLSYYELKNYGGHHSGDIVDAPEGAAEFIDLDCAKLLEKGARYVVMSVNSFTSQPYCDLPECFAGWMARQKPDSGEIFEARTVQDRFDLSSDTQICLPLVVDLETRTVVWMDLALKSDPSWNNVKNNLNGVSLMLRAMMNLEKTTLYDLFAMHIAARGHLVETKEEAEQVFAVHEGLTPFELDIIGSEWM